MNGMELVARGRTAEVFAWETGKVLKLFHPWVSRGGVEYEQRLAQTVHAAGIKTPAVYDILEIENRLGLIYERVNSVTMLQVLRSRPWLATRLARQFAELQASMHACQAPDLPSMQVRLADKIRAARPLPADLQQAALSALQNLPEGDRVCHGDFHPDNILMTEQGPMVIDWIDATAGHPMGDVARTALLTRFGKLPPGMPAPVALLIELLRSTFYRTYLKCYAKLAPFQTTDLSRWLGVVTAARLDEGIAEEESNLLRLTREAFPAGSTSVQEH
jgi:uncharacterized protein (TIGR02172 family)